MLHPQSQQVKTVSSPSFLGSVVMKKNREMFMANDVRICQMSNHLITICSASHLWQKSNLQPLPRNPIFCCHCRAKKAVSPQVGPNLLGSWAFGGSTGSRGGEKLEEKMPSPKMDRISGQITIISPTQISLKVSGISFPIATIWGKIGRVRLQ